MGMRAMLTNLVRVKGKTEIGKLRVSESRGKVYFYSAEREQVQAHDSVVKTENGKLVQASENQVYLSFCNDNADERCLRQQCEISIVCDDGSFSSPKECASALSFSSPKECDKVASKPRFNRTWCG